MFYVSDTIFPPYRPSVVLHQLSHPEYGGSAINRNVGTFKHYAERKFKPRPSIDPLLREPDNLNKVIIIYLFTKRVFTDWFSTMGVKN